MKDGKEVKYGGLIFGRRELPRLTTINQSNKMSFLIKNYIMGFLGNYDVMGFTNPFNRITTKELG